MSSTPPTGLLPSEISALRAIAGVSVEDFAEAFGVGRDVVERWESVGVPTGPTALAIRLVADTMDFEFPVPTLGDRACEICNAPASEAFKGLSVCPSCHRNPRQSLETLGYQAEKTHFPESRQTSYALRFPSEKKMKFTGRFLSEGLGTLLTKIYKEEPQFGDRTWDDAVYVQWVEPGIEALADSSTRDLIRSLVAFGMVDIASDSVSVLHTPTINGFYDEEILLLCGLLASRQS